VAQLRPHAASGARLHQAELPGHCGGHHSLREAGARVAHHRECLPRSGWADSREPSTSGRPRSRTVRSTAASGRTSPTPRPSAHSTPTRRTRP
jgi:hypothetical protein